MAERAATGTQGQGGTRTSALWGTGGKRGSALWGRGGRGAGLCVTVMAFLAMAVPFAASAGTGTNSGSSSTPSFFITGSLLADAQASPQGTFDVIVQGDGSDD